MLPYLILGAMGFVTLIVLLFDGDVPGDDAEKHRSHPRSGDPYDPPHPHRARLR